MAIPPKDTEHCSYSLKPQKKRPASPNTADLDSDSKEGVTSAKKLKNRSTSETRARKRKRKHRKASVVSIMGLDRASESTSAMNIKSIKASYMLLALSLTTNEDFCIYRARRKLSVQRLR